MSKAVSDESSDALFHFPTVTVSLRREGKQVGVWPSESEEKEYNNRC